MAVDNHHHQPLHHQQQQLSTSSPPPPPPPISSTSSTSSPPLGPVVVVAPVASSTATSTPHSSSSPSPPESASQSASSTSSTSSHNVVYQQATSTPHPLTLTQSSSLLVNIQEPGSPINDPLPPYQRPNYPPRPLPSTPRSPGCSPIASPIRSLPPAPPPPQTPLPPIPTKRPQTPQTPQQQQAYLYTTPSPLPPLPPHPSPASPFPAPIRTKQLDQKTAAEDEEEDNEENEESDAHYTDASSTSQPRNAAVPASVDLAVSPTEERDNPFGASAPDLPQKDVPSASISVATATSGRVDRQSELKDETASNDSTQTLPLNDINDSPEHAGRRESIASTASRGSSVMTQRKAGMPGLALGLDAEIKAEEAALAPKRRSIFRTSGTASTPDLTTLIRAKNNKNPQQQQQSTQQRQQPPSSGKGISSGSYQRQSAQSSPPKALSSSSSDTSSKTSLTSHMSPSATALPGRSRERRHEPSRNEWDPYNSETARQMATIVETVTEPNAPQRVPSTDDSKLNKRSKGKGMFGRMFGSSSSNKDHHGPLTSSSQISLTARSTVEMNSPQSQSSPKMANSVFPNTPQFPGNTQYSFEQPPNGNVRPPIPQRPSQPIMPKEHRASVHSHHSSHGNQQEIISEASSHTRKPSVNSISETTHAISTMEQQPHPKRADSHDTTASRSRPPSRRPTGEERGARHAGSSFTDDVTGLLDRIGHVPPPVPPRDTDSEHLQVSPDLSRYSPRTGSPYTDRPYHPGLSRSNTSEGQLPDPLPVGGSDGAPSSVHSAQYDSTPVDNSDPHTVPDPLDVPERSVSTEVDNGTPPDGEWQRNGGIPASSSQIAIEVTSSPGQSTPNLPVEGTDEERGRLLASEFIDGDQTHITSDKVAMFLGGPRHVNNAALRYYMQYFDMRGLKLDQAFRELCAKLHLKAESQEIDRIIEAFSARFYDCNPNTVFGTPGVIHTVTGAMLMLNTDLHIADLQKHMSRADFVRNSMRAIQESMPAGTEPPSDPTNNDSGSLRGIDVSASQSTTSVRLRATASRNASGSLSTELSSNSAADLRSRASSTTVNSFTYTKAWEIEAETALKEIFANVRNERILLPISPMTMPDSDRSQASLGGFGKGVSGAVAGAMNNIKRNARGTGNNGNSPYGSMFTHSDGRLSPTPPYANSIGEQFQPLAPALGFAGNLSHTVIREQEDETHSINSKETMGTLEELNDDELALLGAPWAKEGLLQRKIQVEAQGKKPQKKDWKQYFVVIQRGDLHMFVFGASGGSSIGGGAVGGGNWMTNAKTSGEYSLMHAMAMALPRPGYSASRPYCFTVTFPSGEISVFQAGTEELVAEWVATCNYWAARRSRQPLVGGVSNIEYGWTRVLSIEEEEHLADPDQHDRMSLRSARSQLARLGAINRVRGQQTGSGSLDKIHINDWKPPPHATIPSTLEEEAQLESLRTYVQSLKEELNQHKSIEEPMVRLYTPGSKNANKARDNWTAKSRYIHSEIFKYETYVEALRNAIALRIERQGQKKLERSLARSTVSLHGDLKKAAVRSNSTGAGNNSVPVPAVPVPVPVPAPVPVPPVPVVPTSGAVSPAPDNDDGSGYVTADVDEGTPGRAS